MIPMGDKNNLPLHPQPAPLGLRVFVLRSPLLNSDSLKLVEKVKELSSLILRNGLFPA